MTASQTFDPFALVEFGDASGARPAGDPLPYGLEEFVAYLCGGESGVLGTPAKAKAWIELLTEGLGDVEVTIAERGVIALRVGDEAWPVLLFRPSDWKTRICRACGCTNDLGCDGGCSWSTPRLCSQCVAKRGMAVVEASEGR